MTSVPLGHGGAQGTDRTEPATNGLGTDGAPASAPTRSQGLPSQAYSADVQSHLLGFVATCVGAGGCGWTGAFLTRDLANLGFFRHHHTPK